VATGAIALSVLSGVQERLMVMDNQTKGISTSHYSLFAVIQKLKKVLPNQLEVRMWQNFVLGVCVVSNPWGCSVYGLSTHKMEEPWNVCKCLSIFSGDISVWLVKVSC